MLGLLTALEGAGSPPPAPSPCLCPDGGPGRPANLWFALGPASGCHLLRHGAAGSSFDGTDATRPQRPRLGRPSCSWIWWRRECPRRRPPFRRCLPRPPLALAAAEETQTCLRPPKPSSS